MYVSKYTYIYMYICIYVYIYTICIYILYLYIQVLIPHFAKMEQAKSFNASQDRQRAKAHVQQNLEAAQRREKGGKFLIHKKVSLMLAFHSKYTRALTFQNVEKGGGGCLGTSLT